MHTHHSLRMMPRRMTCVMSRMMFLLVLLTTLAACDSRYRDATPQRRTDERLAQEYLAKARQQMHAGDYDTARKTVKAMRDTCRFALDGRAEGILLVDSIELLRAQRDTTLEDWEMRVRFYEKKLEHDRKKM